MTERDHIRNPVEWSLDQLEENTDLAVVRASHSLRHHGRPRILSPGGPPNRGRRPPGRPGQRTDDFEACRTDVIFLCLIYPIAGLISGTGGLQLRPAAADLPAVAGFALIGPCSASASTR